MENTEILSVSVTQFYTSEYRVLEIISMFEIHKK